MNPIFLPSDCSLAINLIRSSLLIIFSLMLMITNLTRELLVLEELVVNFILPESARKQYSLGKVGKKELESIVEQLAAMSIEYLDQKCVKLNRKQLEAYSLYYLPINFAKLAFLFQQELDFRNASSLKILDYGCGPGTAALAAASIFSSQLEISLFDASMECGSLAQKLVQIYRPSIETKTIHSTDKLEDNYFDLVVAANVLTELSGEVRQQTIERLLKLVSKNGYIVLLEPALKDCTQHLMIDRDRILANHQNFRVQFPCFTEDACPLLSLDSEDWCHGQLPNNSWQRPPLLTQLDELLVFNKHRVKYSAFIFQRSQRISSSRSRVVRPLGKQHAALLCSAKGLVRISEREAKSQPSALKKALKKAESFSDIDTILGSS